MSRQKILVVEDEADILDVLTYNLKKDGFRVLASRNGAEAWELIRRELPDLVLLDRMLPGMDGIEICRRLKADPITYTIHVVMVTAKGEESDVIVGLELGADDYVTKPFSPAELLARVRAVLRRGPLAEEAKVGRRVERGSLVVDAERYEVTVDGKSVTFTATELRLLHFLASHPGRVFTRDQLVSRAIGEHAVVLDRNIDVHIRAIRKKLGECREMIETVRGVGYRFVDSRG